MSRRLRRAAVAASAVLLAVVLGAAAWVAVPVSPRALGGRLNTVELLDRDGVSLRATRTPDGALHAWMPLAEMDPALLVAFVAAEDRRFHAHHGVDARALGRAILTSVRARRVVSGGSTITMQVARLARGLPRTVPGKIRQVLWALRLDAHLSKHAILEAYLNRVPLGQGTAGVEAAARLYFGASARDVSAGQAALLAGIAGAPSRDNPLVSAARAERRRARVLALLGEQGLVAPLEAEAALEEPAMAAGPERAFRAPHFSTALLAGLDDVPATGTIRTTLDLPLQEALEAEVRHTVATLRKSGAQHAAAVALDNRTGGILAWVGSPDFYEPASGQVDMVVSVRQPGSALKPFLYGLAFDRGFTPASVLPDIATVYRTATGPYAPRNYDRRFRGPVRAREALGSSFNVPAVELGMRVGTASLLETLRRAGFVSLRRDATHYGPGLALGNGDVTLLELANGYRALANGGEWRPVRWLESTEPAGTPERVMTARSAALVLDILADPVARIPGFGPVTPLELPFPAAAKTGTSRHFTDNWAVAVTGGFTVAVWVGNFDGRPMEGVSGVSGAGPLLQRAALLTARRHPAGRLPTPAQAGAIQARICRLSGLAPGPRCPEGTEWFPPGHEPGDRCDWHREDGVRLPPLYAEWASLALGNGSQAPAGERLARGSGATEQAGLRILSPENGDVFRFVPGVEARFATVGLRAGGVPRGVAPRWYVDGRRLPRPRLMLVPGRHVVRLEAGGEIREVSVEVLGEPR
jgi:penicillin-binding protein 1C